MDEQDNEIQQLEISIEEAQVIVEDMYSLIRLSKNTDFIRCIEQGYFLHEASRLVLSKAMPDMSTPEHQLAIDNSIIAIGQLRKHFSAVIGMGREAEKTIRNAEEARNEIMKEISDAV